MMRYRIKYFNFDSRPGQISDNINTTNLESRELQNQNKTIIQKSIIENYGIKDLDQKIKRFTEFGNIPFLITWKYDTYFEEIRKTFVIGAFYSALVASCTLVERILNYMFISLRNDYGLAKPPFGK